MSDQPGEAGLPTRRHLRRLKWLGALLVALGAVALLVSTTPSRPTPKVVGGNLPVDAAAAIPSAATTLNSPALALNPTNPDNVVVASRVDAPVLACGLHISLDGGRRWLESPMPVGDEAAKYGCLWPDASFGGDGALYVSFSSSLTIADGNEVPGSVWMTTSHDEGRTLSAPVKATNQLALQSRVTADRLNPNRVYLTWVQVTKPVPFGVADSEAPILVSRSDDGGSTWQPPVAANDPARRKVVMPSMTTGAGGELYLAYVDVGDDTLDYAGEHQGQGGAPYQGKWALVVARSGDGGHTWEQAVVDRDVVPTQRFLMLYPPRPALVADRHGLHVAFQDHREGNADVRIWNSPDGGRTWSGGRKVNDTGANDHTSQYLPQMSASADGRLDIVYYDRRADRADRSNEVSLQSSFDGGVTFAPRLRVSDRGFDSHIGAGLPDLGDKLGLVTTDGAALVMWTDTRAATPAVAKQDLTRAVIIFEQPLDIPSTLRNRSLGAAIAASGLALLVIGTRRRRRPGIERRHTTAGSPVSDQDTDPSAG